ncbi:hypothetical protein N7468_001546 [Penicillium chermesinum]|uniref:Uncharacterized protein n=1 Tax=Penicillium chermesinum TaxID=63820 RepID=A0A9W9TXG3_9EURO|nr:uncharacterized protein N7468_001546 [Penicillium chermesinum]KAJ5246563.1 hypothetical protein N7468_001546 [Penicillium chermesinum]
MDAKVCDEYISYIKFQISWLHSWRAGALIGPARTQYRPDEGPPPGRFGGLSARPFTVRKEEKCPITAECLTKNLPALFGTVLLFYSHACRSPLLLTATIRRSRTPPLGTGCLQDPLDSKPFVSSMQGGWCTSQETV